MRASLRLEREVERERRRADEVEHKLRQSEGALAQQRAVAAGIAAADETAASSLTALKALLHEVRALGLWGFWLSASGFWLLAFGFWLLASLLCVVVVWRAAVQCAALLVLYCGDYDP